MAIKWAPWFVPMRRRLEVLATFCFIFTITALGFVSFVAFTMIFFYGGLVWKTVCTAYLIHFYLDRKSHENCNRGQGYELLRGARVWKYFASYFPLKLVKTVDLTPDKNYLFAIYPHGVISCGAFCNFATSATNFRDLFPAIRSKFCTVTYHFYTPMFREMVLGWGMISAKSKSMICVLSQTNDKDAECNQDGFTSNAVSIAIGGARESLESRPGVYKLLASNRKGFIKVAIQSGAHIVPVFSFNEVEVFDQLSNNPGSLLRKFQEFLKTWTTVTVPIIIGRGFLQYSFGLLPRRHPITTVVGSAIPTVKNKSPTGKEIDELHGKFIEALIKLFEDNKHLYLKNSQNIKLELA